MAAPYYTIDNLQPANSVGYLIKRCGVLMNQIAEQRFQSQPITFTQWLVLIHLTEHPRLSPTQLSLHLGHDMGALTRVVDDLEKQELVRRERSEQDRRAVLITATPEGRRRALAAKVFVLDIVNELVEPYSKADTELMVSLLQRLLLRMQDVAARTGFADDIDPKITVGQTHSSGNARVVSKQAASRRRRPTR
jgi:DNA-binding MarR family transcriptional regulator